MPMLKHVQPADRAEPIMSTRRLKMVVEHEVSELTPITFKIGEVKILFSVSPDGGVLIMADRPATAIYNNHESGGCWIELYASKEDEAAAKAALEASK